MKAGAKRFHGCNVLAATATGRHLWQFSLTKDRLAPAGEFQAEPGKPLPARALARDWQTLLQPRLNLAWLPADTVFVRAVQLPAGDPAELPALVEFQLEKISPLPVNQIVWTAFGVPHPDGRQQTALVIVAARPAVEEFLDRQVTGGFTPAELDLPLVRAWRDLKPEEDGIWLLFEATPDRRHCLAGWFVGGIWRDVTLLTLPPGTAGPAMLTGQLGQMAWAGEMEGWVGLVPPVTIVAEPELAAEFERPLADWSAQPVRTKMPTANAALAAASARALLIPPAASLVPLEWSTTQRQKFVDRIWLRALGAVGIAYLAFVFLFLITLSVRKYQLDDLRSEVGAMGLTYTNTLQLKSQVAILEEQVALRYAALDAWRAAVENLPESLTLAQLDFQKGRTLVLRGTALPESAADITQFNTDLKKVEVNGQPLFAEVKPARIEAPRPGSADRSWSFEAELRRGERP